MNDQERTTQEALLKAAEELFAERGFADVGNREITARAGANLAAIKYHFGSKHGLYEATVRRVFDNPDYHQVWELLHEEPHDREDAIRRLAAFLHRLLLKLLADEEIDSCAKIMMREALRPSESIGEIIAEHHQPYDEWLGRMLLAIAPDLSRADSLIAGWSVLGPIYHLYLFRNLFQLQERSIAFGTVEPELIADKMILFSLRGLGCSEELIERSLRTDVERESNENS